MARLIPSRPDVRPGRTNPWRRAAALLGSVALLAGVVLLRGAGPTSALDRNEVRILAGAPSTYDPAAAGDSTTSIVVAQLYETLTTYDASLTLQPALAQSWDVSEDGKQVTFHLRPDLTFSDGSPLTAEDVVGSWLRLIDPDAPAPLVALMLDVRGAHDHLARLTTDPAAVGLRAQGSDVIVDLDRPGADFPAIVSAPLFGVVPPAVWRDGGDAFGPGAVVSGGYAVESASSDEITLQRNERYWAGPPAVPTVRLMLDIGGRSPIAAFEAGDLDFAEVSAIDAPWIPFDADLGPQLREFPSLALTYLGFDTTASRSMTSACAAPSVRPWIGSGRRPERHQRPDARDEHGPAGHPRQPGWQLAPEA